jgi:hypothetical protein
VGHLERDHVDEQVVAVCDRECSFLIAVEGDDVTALAGVLRGDRDVPAVVCQRARNRAADAARPTEDERALSR